MKLLIAVIAFAAFSLGLAAAQAQGSKSSPTAASSGIDQQCLKVKDQRGCTCAIETGGSLMNGRWRYSNSRMYTDCMMKKGWM